MEELVDRGLMPPIVVVLVMVWFAAPREPAGTVAFLLLAGLAVWAVSRPIGRLWRRQRSTSKRALAPGRRYLRPPAWPEGWATTPGIQAAGLHASSGPARQRVYLGQMDGLSRRRIGCVCERTRVFAPRGESALVVGPTGSGKTSSVLAPTLVGWGPGPVVVTSTKPDVLETWGVREAEGMNTLYDPTGSVGRPDLCVGWSPLARCGWWDGAVECAAVMLQPQALDTTSLNAQHFAAMAKQLLAPLLHAAALAGRPIAEARGWLLSAEFSEPLEILDQHNAAAAAEELRGVALLPFGEHQSGILATAATALGWVVRDSVRASTDPDETDQLDIDAFLDRGGTLYIVSPSRTMHELAPLTAALVDAIAARGLERAVEQGGQLQPRLLLALDEAANIAPLASLPSLVAEGGQQGVTSIVVLQDISQAYERWGRNGAHTLWNNATVRVVLPGVADPATVDLVSKFAGEIERWVPSVSNQTSRGHTGGKHGSNNWGSTESKSWSTRVEPLLRGGDVQRLRRGEGLLLARSLPPARLALQPELPSAGPPAPPALALSAATATREALGTAEPDLEVSEQLSGVGAPAPG